MTTTKTGSETARPTPAAATRAGPSPASTDSYEKGYAELSMIADRLRTATGAAHVDTLLADVQAARRIHKQLRARLDAVRRELEADAASEEDAA